MKFLKNKSKENLLWDAYNETSVEISLGDKVLTENQLQSLWRQDFFMITASNPFSQRLSIEENKSRNEELRVLLSQDYVEILAGIGKSPNGTWAEEGWVVRGGDEAKLISLAKKFQQNAIFKFTSSGREIINCQ